MHKAALALGWGQGLLFALLRTPLPPQGSVRRNVSFSNIATTFSCTSRARAKLRCKPSIWSGDNGVTKHLAHLLWHHSGLLVAGEAWSPVALQKALFTGVGRSRDASSQISHKGSLP